MQILPTSIRANDNMPPEVEIRFDLESSESTDIENWNNWSLTFVMNQLFDHLDYPGRFCPGAHHSTIVRKGKISKIILFY